MTALGFIFAWLSLGLILELVLQICLATYCWYMMPTDAGPVDHGYNCGVLIYGSQSVFCFVLGCISFGIGSCLLKGNSWQVCLKQVQRVFGTVKRR
jgi:hypothetical protein